LVAAAVIALAAAGTYFVTRGSSTEALISEMRAACAASQPPGEPLRAVPAGQARRFGDGVNRAQRARVELLSVIQGLDAPEDLDPQQESFLAAFRKTNRSLGRLQLSVARGKQRDVGTGRDEVLRRARAERKAARQLGTPECGGLGIL
jgi:hypothetical protein